MGDVAKIFGGATPNSHDPSNFTEKGGIPWLTPADLSGYDGMYISRGKRNITEKGYKSCSTKLMPAGAVLFSSRAPIGYVVISSNEICTSQGFKSFAPYSGVNSKYLYYYLKFSKDAITLLGTGSTFREISGKKAENISLILAPINEQKRIAEKLDEMIAEINSIRARLDKIPIILKKFRTSILAQAISGFLTKGWRNKHDIKLSDWESHTFKDLCSHITVGFVGKMSDQYTENGIPFLRSQNVRPFRYDPRGLKFISEKFHRKISKSTLTPGDIAVVRSGAPGQCCVIPQELSEANCSDLVILRPNEKLLSEYSCIYINSETSQSYVRSNQVGIAQQHFNVGSMKKAPVMLPTLEEQKEIIRIVSESYNLADEAERKYDLAIKSLNEISQSILKRAFQGELVSQDLNDEHASILLEKIKVDKKTERLEGQRQKIYRASSKNRKKQAKVEDSLMTNKLQEVLAEHQKWLSAQEVFQLCGIGKGSQTDEIETLYAELRLLDKLGKLEIDSVCDSDGIKQYDRLKLKKAG